MSREPVQPAVGGLGRCLAGQARQPREERAADLIIISDDVYGTFVPHYRSLLDDLPYNTACVYSFSKYFGATGWRLAVIATAQNNVFDDLIAKLPTTRSGRSRTRYACLTDHIEKVKFTDRMVARLAARGPKRHGGTRHAPSR